MIEDESRKKQYESILEFAEDSSVLDSLIEYETLISNSNPSNNFSLLQNRSRTKSVEELFSNKSSMKLHNGLKYGYLVAVCSSIEYDQIRRLFVVKSSANMLIIDWKIWIHCASYVVNDQIIQVNQDLLSEYSNRTKDFSRETKLSIEKF